MKYIDENVERLHRYLGVNSTGNMMPHIKRFIRFLYDYNLYSRFIYNFLNASESWKKEEHKRRCDGIDFIFNAFDWASTPQGHDFWLKYNNIWNKNHMKWMEEND